MTDSDKNSEDCSKEEHKRMEKNIESARKMGSFFGYVTERYYRIFYNYLTKKDVAEAFRNFRSSSEKSRKGNLENIS